MSMFFSEASVRRVEPLVRDTVNKLTNALSTHKGTGKPVTVTSAYSGFATDIISEYAFARNFNLLDDHTFSNTMSEAFSKGRAGLHWAAHFPILFQILIRLPKYVLLALCDCWVSDDTRFLSSKINPALVPLSFFCMNVND